MGNEMPTLWNVWEFILLRGFPRGIAVHYATVITGHDPCNGNVDKLLLCNV